MYLYMSWEEEISLSILLQSTWQRNNHSIDDTIILNDIVYFTTTKICYYIRKIAGKREWLDIRNVMIMGGSRIAVRTVQYMPEYMRTKIIESDFNRCNRLTRTGR